MSIYLSDPDVTIHLGDVLDVLSELPSESVHMCCTSPPFYGLRDYGTGLWEGGDPDCDHRKADRVQDGTSTLGVPADGGKRRIAEDNATVVHKEVFRDVCGKCGAQRVDQQIGLEATPDEYVARLVEVFREVRRVLRSDGSLWLEIGDSYNSAASNDWSGWSKGGAQGIKHGERGDRPENTAPRAALLKTCKPKDLIGAPWLLAFALRADGWYLRSEIIWAKPNPMPESVTDRPTTSHSRVFLLTKSSRYFYDAEAIRERAEYGRSEWNGGTNYKGGDIRTGHTSTTVTPGDGGDRNRRSVWTIATQPYPEAHFATWPEALCRDMILAGTSERGVCPECGAPWERITETMYQPVKYPGGVETPVGEPVSSHKREPHAVEIGGPQSWEYGRARKIENTIGWEPSCSCYARERELDPDCDPQDAPWMAVPATVLDPFGGSGTTGLVARTLGRRAVLIELNADYCALAARRLQQQSLFA